MINYSLGTVVSSRVRLARNVAGYPFPSRMHNEKLGKEIIRRVFTGLNKKEEFHLYHIDNISIEEANALKENHLISPALMQNEKTGAVLINNDKTISIMINEEDHLREQYIVKGNDLYSAYNTLSEWDGIIARSITFAYDERLGYLTACPTNLGTGLRASVMLFLPALTINGIMPEVVRNISYLGLTVRGVYGEGSKAEGYMYQVSNEVTLGVTEKEILDEVTKVVKQIVELEGAERAKLAKEQSPIIKDKCLRSYGILTNCALLSSDELVELCANVKLGVCLGYFQCNDISSLDDLMVRLRPSNINADAHRILTAEERDTYRAQTANKHIRKTVFI